MKNENYQISIHVNADAKNAFENICNVKAWWTANIEGRTNQLNDVFTVLFGETFVGFKITEFKPYSQIVWYVTDCNIHFTTDKKEWKDTSIEWNISEEREQTKITMTHIGLIPAVECYDNCEKGWNFYTGMSLVKLINEGKGLADTPAKERATV
ncbi:MAG: SRPBCC domain-containing protein [Parafilimonas sp.]|nr:SRPBCC domain-containing protein [Parafilimonas sp.]